MPVTTSGSGTTEVDLAPAGMQHDGFHQFLVGEEGGDVRETYLIPSASSTHRAAHSVA
jgi:hypothetical protein